MDSAELPTSPAARARFTKWVEATDPGAVLAVRIFDDGTYAAVKRLLFHYTLIYGIIGDAFGYENRWCYQTLAGAEAALRAWQYPSQAEPEGWHRNPRTGRRRPEGDAAREYIDA